MENNHKISIVIPIYNTEKYLEDCLESIRTQTFTNYELILVDDGSIDESLKICYKYVNLFNGGGENC